MKTFQATINLRAESLQIAKDVIGHITAVDDLPMCIEGVEWDDGTKILGAHVIEHPATK